jgi:hypothetical protein
MGYCAKCGAQVLNESADFCAACGASLASPQSSTPRAERAPGEKRKRPNGTTSLGLGIISVLAALVALVLRYLPLLWGSGAVSNDREFTTSEVALSFVALPLALLSLVGAVMGLIFGLRGLRETGGDRHSAIVGIALSAVVLAYVIVGAALRNLL